jgi:hypothetical protein
MWTAISTLVLSGEAVVLFGPQSPSILRVMFVFSAKMYAVMCVICWKFVVVQRRIGRQTGVLTGAELNEVANLMFEPQSEETNLTDVLHYVETAALLVRDICRAKTTEDYSVAIFHAAKHYHGGSVSATIGNMIARVMFDDREKEVFEPQAEFIGLDRFIDKFRDAVALGKKARDAELFKRARKLGYLLLTTGLVKDIGLEFNEEIFQKNFKDIDKSNKVDLTLEFADHFSWLVKSGYQMYHRDFYGALFGGQEYTKFLTNYSSCKAYFAGRVDYGDSKYLDLLCTTIELGERFGVKDKFIFKCTTELKTIRQTITAKANAVQSRPVPFSMLIFGNPGVGKSSLMSNIFKTWSLIDNSVEYKDTMVYTRHPGAQYWDGFSTEQAFCILDDIGFIKPKSQMADNMQTEIIQIVNDVPYVPNQAALEDKGRVPFRCKVVLGSTNVKEMNVYHYFTTPEAALRRFPYVITVSVRPECRRGDTDFINPEISETEQLDPWQVTLEEVSLINRMVVYTPLKAADGTELIDVPFRKAQPTIVKLMRRHMSIQSKSSQRKEDLKKQKLCVHDTFVSLCPECSSSSEEKVAEEKDVNNVSENSDVTINLSKHWSETPQETLITDYSKELEKLVPPNPFVMSPQSDEAFSEGDFINTPFSSEDITGEIDPAILRHFREIDELVPDGVIPIKLPTFWEKIQMGADKALILCGSYLKWDDEKKWVPNSLRVAFQRACVRVTLSHMKDKSLAHQLMYYKRRLSQQAHQYGETMKNVIFPRSQKLKVLAAALAVLTGAYFSWKLLRSETSEDVPQGGDFSSVGVRGEKESTWVKTVKRDELPTPAGVGASFPSVISKYSSNSSTVKIIKDKKVSFSNLIALRGSLYLLPRHLAQKMVGSECELYCLGKKYSFKPAQCDIKWSNSTDLAIVNILCAPPRSNFMKYITSGSCPLTSGVMVYTDKYENLHEVKVNRMSDVENVPMNLEFINTLPHVLKYRTSIDTHQGLCGSPLFVPGANGGVILAGMHCAGINNKDHGMAIPLRMDIIEDLIQKMDTGGSPVAAPQGDVIYSVPEAPQTLGDIHHKSIFAYADRGSTNVFGSFLGFRQSHTTRVEPTIAAPILEEHGIVASKVAPVMKGWVPWRNSFLDSCNLAEHFDWDRMQECADSFYADVVRRIPLAGFAEIHKVNQHVALNGQAGCRFVDSMNRQTSAGFPYNKAKNKGFILQIGPTEENQESIGVDDRIQRDIDYVLDCYAKGERASPIFKGSLKDEPIKPVKREKPRVFMGAPFGFCVVVRMYLLMFTRFFQLHSTVFENAVGVDCESSTWNDFYQYLIEFGRNRVFAGDYSKFDKGQSARIIMVAFQFIGRVCLLSPHFDEEDFKVIMTIGTDIAFNFCHFNGDLVQFMGSMPSGNPLTVVINCIVNSLYMRYCYRSLGGNLRSFQDKVHLLTYGDDNICGVSPDVEFFNHTTVQEEFAKVRIVYTMPDKEAMSKPFSDIDELDFLKRRFVVRDGHCYCPLDENSIRNSVAVWVRSKTICPQWQMADTIQSAMRNAFQHGPEFFERFREICVECCEKLNLYPYVPAGALYDFAYYKDVVVDLVNKGDAEKLFRERMSIATGPSVESGEFHSQSKDGHGVVVTQSVNMPKPD